MGRSVRDSVRGFRRGRGRTRGYELQVRVQWKVDQVFLERKGGRIQVVCSMVSGRGDLRNLAYVSHTDDPVQAVRDAARHTAGRGDVSGARGARVRWSRHQAASEQNALLRTHTLEDEFLDAFEEEMQLLRDQQR